MTEEKLEYKKMRERLDWAFEELLKRAKQVGDTVDPNMIFQQACEMARSLFVRSEIAYSGKRG